MSQKIQARLNKICVNTRESNNAARGKYASICQHDYGGNISISFEPLSSNT